MIKAHRTVLFSLLTLLIVCPSAFGAARRTRRIPAQKTFLIPYLSSTIRCAEVRGARRAVYRKKRVYQLTTLKIRELTLKRRRLTGPMKKKLRRRIRGLRRQEEACRLYTGPDAVPTATPTPYNFSASCTGEGRNWTAPIGIPRPEFGIDQSADEIYGPGFYTHYVDSTSPNATDTDNPNGSPERPRLTIPSEVSAGSVVIVNGGPYPTTWDRVLITGHGTPERPIFVRGLNPDNPPVFRRKIMPQGEYMIFENLLLENCGFDIRPFLPGAQVHHIAVRSVELSGNGKFKEGGTVGLDGLPGREVTDIVVFKNEIHDNGDYLAAAEDDTCGVAVGSNVHRAWILNNHSYRNGGDSVIVSHGADFSTDHIYIGCNHFHNERENAVDIKEANDVIVSQNSMHSFRTTSSSSGEALAIHYEPRRIWVLYNEIFDSALGLITSGSDDTYFIGNRIFGIHHFSDTYYPGPGSVYSFGTAVHARNSGKVHVVSNTIYDVDNGISAAVNTEFNVVNNIVAKLAGTENSFVLFVDSQTPARSTISNNLIFQPGSSEFGLRTGTFWADPLFVDPDVFNFRLQAQSPAVNAGATYPYAQAFQQLYGLSIERDYDNHERVQSGAVDIGAHEQ